VIALTTMFFLAGLLGWQFAAWTAPWVTFGRWRIGSFSHPVLIAFAGGTATVVGLLLFGYERLRDRLTDSVARLKEHEFAERELESAREIQRRLLPPARFAGDGFVVVARNEAARLVAGDFYDIFPLADGSIAVAVGDVAGKGMGASLLMASVKAMLPLLGFERGVGAAFRDLNERLFAQLGSRQFVALALARFDPRSGELWLANAGLPDPYRLSAGGATHELNVPGPRLPLGASRAIAYRELSTALAPGERLLLLTDGLPEAQVGNGEPLGYARFEELLAELTGEPAAAIDQIFARVAARSPPPLDDDATLLLVERAPA
jgi:sigma-B regulation protein RsbU (phosphoserine phosphatase)